MDLFVVIVVHAPKKSKHCHVKITLYGHAKGFLYVFKASVETKDKMYAIAGLFLLTALNVSATITFACPSALCAFSLSDSKASNKVSP